MHSDEGAEGQAVLAGLPDELGSQDLDCQIPRRAHQVGDVLSAHHVAFLDASVVSVHHAVEPALGPQAGLVPGSRQPGPHVLPLVVVMHVDEFGLDRNKDTGTA